MLEMSDKKLELLQAIYDSLPSIDCKGECWESCGPIDVSKAERRFVSITGNDLQLTNPKRVARHLLNKHPDDNDGCLTCPMLSQNRCRIYDRRPLLCRLWGIAESMPCTFGCKPSRYLTDSEVQQIMSQVWKL